MERKDSGFKETRDFLEIVLKNTFIPRFTNENEIEMREEYLEYCKTSEGKKHVLGWLKKSYPNIRKTILDKLKDNKDYGGFVKQQEEEVKNMKKTVKDGTKSYKEFINSNSQVLNYITKLYLGGNNLKKILKEESVLNTLRRLSGNVVMGEMGVGREACEATFSLMNLVKDVSYKHAKNIGKRPDRYYSRLEKKC